jgi:hypothetical protein
LHKYLQVLIICKLAQEVNHLKFQNGLNNLNMTLVAVDGTLLKALPKMLWALWLDEDRRAAKVTFGIRHP